VHSAEVTKVDFRALVEQSADVIAVYDRDHRFVYVNGALERATGVRAADILGKTNDDTMPPEAAVLWREALDHVLTTGGERTLECTLDTPQGPRRFASIVVRTGEHACAMSRDVTDLDSVRMFDVAVRTMTMGICVLEAPSGRILFHNDRVVNVWGPASRDVADKQDFDAHVAFDRRGRRISGAMWPAARAVGGENVLDEHIELVRTDGLRRMLRMNAAPVRDAQGRITAAVVTYQDVTETMRAHDAAAYLAKAGALLAHFDQKVSLQAIVDLAVPVLADRAMIHLQTGDHATIAAVAHTDPAKFAAARARIGEPYAVVPNTAVGRVLAGGPAELVQIDTDVLENASTDAAHLEQLRSQGYRSAVVAPLAGGDGVLGALTFATAESGRRYEEADFEIITEIARRTGIAFENARLFAAERRARAEAEAARVRERVLHVTAARLSSAQTVAQIATVVCEQVITALGADIAAAGIRSEDTVKILGSTGVRDPSRLAPLSTLPIATPLPLCEAVLRSEIVWCATEAELDARYGGYRELRAAGGVRSWGAVPFSFEGRTVGALAITFCEERELPDDDRELLRAIGQLTAQAIERAHLHDALRTSEENLRAALAAARAGTWRVDLRKMTTTRDPTYGALLGVPPGVESGANFDDIHPDDQPTASVAFDRARRDDLPYTPEVRVRRGDGSYIWTRTYARITRGEDGRAQWIGGITFDIDDAKRASLLNETMHRLGASFASELDHDRLVQRITEEVTALVGAESGAFGDIHVGLDLDAPASQLAVPVAMRSGEMVGTLVFGHREPGRFTEIHERLAAGIAAQAAVALENARLYREVQEREQEARLAERRKDEFLAMLGHELRNPLAPITTALDLMDLKAGEALDRERQVIRRQVDHLSRLIDDLLDVARITRGELELVREVVELSEILVRAVEMASPLLEKRVQRLSIDVPREGLLVDVDPMRLGQVLQNVLNNASKYSDRHADVSISARSTPEGIVIAIRDSGVGIAPELLPRLFDIFVQGAQTIDRAEGGLGLGLAIARSLCELHGGTISAASDGVGRGSTFTIRLPNATRPPTPRSERTTGRMPKLTRGMRILVVDDNHDAAALLHTYLAELGHDPVVAHDGAAALELAGTFRPEIAVLDIGLPVMDGYELARRLRDQHGKLRLIALTGYGQPADRARAAEAGFDHHLVKPVEIEQLTDLLTK
jgi:PAS domain S-box-containing protein